MKKTWIISFSIVIALLGATLIFIAASSIYLNFIADEAPRAFSKEFAAFLAGFSIKKSIVVFTLGILATLCSGVLLGLALDEPKNGS